MKRHVLFLIAALLVAGPVLGGEQGAAAESVCIVNGNHEAHVFVAEARGGERKMSRLAPGEELCAAGATERAGGVVSVFEDEDAFEGCSRVVEAGRTEVMKKYVDFDRCFWSSNS